MPVKHKLQMVTFFISLPEYMAVPDFHKIRFPVLDYPSNEPAVHYVDEKGINMQWSVSMRIHQLFYLSDDRSMSAILEAYKRAYEEERNSEETIPKGPEITNNITVVEVNLVTEDVILDDNKIGFLFRKAVSQIVSYQKSYHVASKDFIEFLTLKNTSQAILYTTIKLSKDGHPIEGSHEINPSVYVTPGVRRLRDSDEVLKDQQLEDINTIAPLYSEGVLASFYNTRREAYIAYGSGNSVVASLMTSVSAEIILDELLLIAMWEDGLTPKEAFNSKSNEEYESLYARVKSDLYTSRFGANWNLDSGPLRDWKVSMLRIRNRIAHTGYEPTPSEMDKLFSNLQDLVKFIGNTLSDNVDKYPLSAMMFISEEGLRKRKSWTRFNESPNYREVPSQMHITFTNWKYEVERFEDADQWNGSRNKAVTAIVLSPLGKVYWVLLDENKRLACWIPDQKITNEKYEAGIDKAVKDKSKNISKNILIQIDNHKVKLKKGGHLDWFPTYTITDLRKISRWPVSYILPTIHPTSNGSSLFTQ